MLPVDPLVLLAFIPAGLALNLTPGADMMFCLGQGLRSGRRAAMAANFGIAAGGIPRDPSGSERAAEGIPRARSRSTH